MGKPCWGSNRKIVFFMSLVTLLEEFKDITDRDLRYDILIETSDRFQEVLPNVATRPFSDVNKAPACESEAYGWVTKNSDGTCTLHFAVENPQGISAKALGVILKEGLDGESAKNISEISEQIVYDIFGTGLGMGKGQGLMGMVRIIKSEARKLC